MPTPAHLLGAIIFGAVGLAAFVYGKNSSSLKAIVIGILLMVYPYFVPEAWMIFLVGAALTASLFVFKD